MDNVCLTIPVQPGKSDAARAFLRRLDDDRRDEYARSEQRIGISKELWFMSSVADQDVLVGYMEAEDFGRALGGFSGSQDEFDMWFKSELANATGLDLNDPPEMQLPELLSNFEAAVAIR
jgi:Family of unknown function (DUF6176)